MTEPATAAARCVCDEAIITCPTCGDARCPSCDPLNEACEGHDVHR